MMQDMSHKIFCQLHIQTREGTGPYNMMSVLLLLL